MNALVVGISAQGLEGISSWISTNETEIGDNDEAAEETIQSPRLSENSAAGLHARFLPLVQARALSNLLRDQRRLSH